MARGPIRIAITLGDSRGIGPEIVAKTIAGARIGKGIEPVFIGSGRALAKELKKIGRGRVPAVLDPGEGMGPGQASFEYVRAACDMALEGKVDAIVTGPVSKEAINKEGIPFTGHTEFLEERTGAKRAVMLLCSGRVRVALVTTHAALRDVPGAITVEKVHDTILVTARGLVERFGFPRPRIAVCALNPHGGEGGVFGDEEAKAIAPAIEAARREGFEVSGPHPADGLFPKLAAGDYDAAVAMYHDQGMIPAKRKGVGRGVNVTLGLPIIRTSVAHGVALDIAGKGIANPGSLVEAIRLAALFARRNRRD